MATQSDPIYSLPHLYKFGCVISNDATTPNTVLNISSGQVRDTTNSIDIPLGSTNPPLNGSATTAPLSLNAAVNGANGLDTGSLAASEVYAVCLIGDSSYKKPVASILTLDSATSTGPVLPLGYDSFRIVGYAVTDSSVHFLKAYCWSGHGAGILLYDAPQATGITAGASTSYAPVDLSALVPVPYIGFQNVPVYIKAQLTPNAASDKLFLQPANATGDAIVINGQVTTVPIINYSWIMAQIDADTSLMGINYKVSAGTDAAAISVAGFQF